MSTETMELLNNHTESRQRALQEHVLLLAPSFSFWRGNYQLPRAKVAIELDGGAIDANSVTTPQSKLLTDHCPTDASGTSWKKRFQRLATQQTAVVERYSVPFPIRGVRIIPKASGGEFLRELDDIRRDLDATADEFVGDFERIRAQIKQHTDPGVWDAVQHKIPQTPKKLRDKFSIDIVPIELAGGGVSSTVTAGDLAAHYDIVRDATRRKVEEAIEEMISGPRQQLAEALSGLRDLIARDGRVTAKSFNPVRDAIAKIRAFDFVANADLLTQIRALEGQLDRTVPVSLTSAEAAASGFSAALGSALSEVEDARKTAATIEEFGRELRGIQL